MAANLLSISPIRLQRTIIILLSGLLVLLNAQYSIRKYQPLCNRCGCCKPRYVNPCSQGPPILTPYGQPAYCDPCSMPPSSGQGTAALPRFFFDKLTRTCKPFMYRGLLGNANNFLSKALCELTCPALRSPCLLGPPAPPPPAGSLVPPPTCSVVSMNTCPATFWCHIGPTADTTACCPGAGPPCTMPLLTGEGVSSLPRWFYDAEIGACRQFTYLGTKGNQNNFLTREACMGTCRPFVNPCQAPVDPTKAVKCSPPGINPTPCPPGLWCHIGAAPETTLCCPGACVNPCNQGKPLKGYDNRPRPCTRTSLCPTTFYCHVGAIPDTTVCCVAFGNPCDQPMTPGTGPSALPRFYYDRNQRQCLPFTYRGLKGNQNNFLTMQDCQALCFTLINPCPTGEPLVVAGRPRQCAPTSPCPPTHWCHIGAGPDTTVCCLITGNPCELTPVRGEGRSSLRRWYFDITSMTCIQFTYQGLKGNENNFLSQRDCENVCPVFENPCPQGGPPTDPTGRPVPCGPRLPCQPGFWCHLGAGPETTTCCPNAGDPCRMPRTEGLSGRIPVSLSRYYFDQNSRQCQPFVYLGLKGNQNNFPTLESCRQTCGEINPCQPPDTPFIQPGDGFLKCQGGPYNNCPNTHFCLVGSGPETSACCPVRGSPCDQPQLQGTGVDQLPRYSYNALTDECAQFTYRGLQGNANNFLSLEDCEDTCSRFKDFCPHGKPLIIDQEPQTCSIETACPQEYVCHINAAPQIALSTCCPAPASFCFLQRDPGPCTQGRL